MNKKIIQVAVAGEMAINAIGGSGLVLAYDGSTIYPENGEYGITVTMIDERNDLVSLYFDEPGYPGAVLKGVKLFNGVLNDSAMRAVDFTREPWTTEYLATSMYDDDFEDMVVGEERVFEMDSSLAASDLKEMGMVHIFWNSSEDETLNIAWGRVNLKRCADSEVYKNSESAICRAEKWEDGKLHYQPYEEWTRLSLPDETDEERQITVFKDGEWVEETVSRVDSGGDSEEETGEDLGEGVGDSEEGTGEDLGEGTGEISEGGPEEGLGGEVVEKIIEVPVEREVIKTVEVPVERTVVDVREVIKEVPVEAQTVLTESIWAGTDGTLAMVEVLDGEEVAENEDTDDENSDETEDNKEDTEGAELGEPAAMEMVEVPELGKEISGGDSVATKITTFLAGVISASALLILAIVFRRRKQDI